MKRITTLLMTAATIVAGNLSLAQANSQGNVIVDAYYGFPNLGKNFYNAIEKADGTGNFKATGVGPMGIRAEYMVSDRIGVGFDVIYNSNNVSYTDVDTVSYDGGTGTYVTENVRYERTMDRLRVQARFNYHFEVNNPDLDAYFGVAAGTNNRFRKFYREGVEQTDDFDGGGNLTLIPVSLRVCTGLRYYFTENIGINAEIGLGGPLISGGLSVRF